MGHRSFGQAFIKYFVLQPSVYKEKRVADSWRIWLLIRIQRQYSALTVKGRSTCFETYQVDGRVDFLFFIFYFFYKTAKAQVGHLAGQTGDHPISVR